MRLRVLQPLRNRRPLFFELCNGPRGIALQRLLARYVGGQRGVEPVQLRETTGDSVAPGPSSRELMRKIVSLLAQLRERASPSSQGFVRSLVRRLRLGDRLMDSLDLLGRCASFGICRF